MSRFSSLIGFLLLVLTACQPGDVPVSAEEEAAIRDEITRWYEQRAERVVAQVHPVWGEQMGAEAAESITSAWYPIPDSLVTNEAGYMSVESMEYINMHVEVLAPNVAHVLARVRATATGSDGQPETYEARWTAVWLKRHGEWSELMGAGG